MQNDVTKLVEDNMRLVPGAIWRNFAGYIGPDSEDLLAAGYVGLVLAARRFDPERGYKFSTYAVPMILGECRHYLRGDHAVRLSRSLHELSAKMARMDDGAALALASEQGVGREMATALLERRADNLVSLDVRYTDKGGRNGGTLLEMLPGDDDCAEESCTRLDLDRAMSSLTPRQQAAVRMRYFANMQPPQIAKALGVGRSGLYHIEQQAMRRLRSYFGVGQDAIAG